MTRLHMLFCVYINVIIGGAFVGVVLVDDCYCTVGLWAFGIALVIGML